VIVLVHAGVCDAEMWDGFDLPGAVRHELRGFGATPMPPSGRVSHADDLEERLGGQPAALVGASFGGQVCLELAARRPELVAALVLLDAALPDHPWSPEVLGYARDEDELLEQGELRAAAELTAEFWVTRPALRPRVAAMQERAYELQLESEAEEDEVETIELGAVTAPTLVAVGELDKPDFHAIGERLAREIPDARLVRIAGAGHLPALEEPEATAALVGDFLRASRI
jgi:3-oxoadipate enol-lactonase